MKVTGIDLSLTGTGIAIHEAGGLEFVAEVGEDGKAGATMMQRADRIDRLVAEICGYAEYSTLAVLEAHDFGVKHSASSHDRSGAFWRVVHELRGMGVQVAQATPQVLKMYMAGSGTASKDSMLVAAVRRHPTIQVMTNNQADALSACSMGVRWLELAPMETVWNQQMERAMTKAEWPV